MSDDIIARSVAEAIIDAPLASVDLAEWVFTLTDAEYRACSKDHIACGATRAADGRRMSINVETVGNLLVQHYYEDIAGPHLVRLVSNSDSFGPSVRDRATVRVVWEFAAEAIDAATSRLVNQTSAHGLPGYREALQSRGVSFEQASAAATAVMSAHDQEETPLFARDIGQKARARRWR